MSTESLRSLDSYGIFNLIAMRIWCCILLVLFFIGCRPDTDRRVGIHEEASDLRMRYSDSVSGWSTQYPKSWPLLTAKEIAEIERRGAQMLEPDSNGKLPITNKQLLWLKKDEFNSFTSNYETFGANDGPYEEVEREIFKLIESSFHELGLHVESRVDKATLDGLEFIRYQAAIYSADRSSIIMNQVMYCRLVDNRISILLNANYNNDADRTALLAIIEGSKFAIRD